MRDFGEKEEAIMFSMSLQGNQVASAKRARFKSNEFKEGYHKCRYCDYYVIKMSLLIQHEAIHPIVRFD